MSANSRVFIASLTAAGLLSASTALSQVNMPMVVVGFPGNPSDLTTGHGAVAYTYKIGQFEVTVAQYVAFLNAVASTDTHGLYDSRMGPATQSFSCGWIVRSGSNGSYVYSHSPFCGGWPVNYVSFWNSVRFANWLHNGQPTGLQTASSTEDGAYTLTPSGIANNSVVRNPGARWALPTLNEWYKAAYYQPKAAGGEADGYWLSATQGAQSFAANLGGLGLMDATSFDPFFYGLFNMAGNVCEWNEQIADAFEGDRALRGRRGGGFRDGLAEAQSWVWYLARFPSSADVDFGFRVVQVFACGLSDIAGPGGSIGPDGELTADDILRFIGAFTAGTLSTADIAGPGGSNTPDGELTADDILLFINRFTAGC
jgi:formylglycine-generating enzyme required for sulfatase activity